MEVVHEGAVASGSNLEYEMNQDAMTEEDYAMEYAAQSHQEQGGEHVYEVTMEEYGHDGEEEGEMQDASQDDYAEEADVMDDAGTHAEEVEEEEEEQYIEEETEAGNDVQEQRTEEADEEAQVVPAEEMSRLDAVEHKIEEGESSASILVSKDGGETTQVIEEVHVKVPKAYTDEDDHVAEKGIQNATNEEEGGEEEVTAEEQISDEKESQIDATHSNPTIRVTYNGQDFVLFPHSEPSSYISAQGTEPIAAPRLEAEEQVYFESMDSFFQSLRVKEALGDFLEEGSELQVHFVDLDLILREDDIYAREISLNDIHRIHLGYGLTSSLHLVISEVARFITRYNELAGHVSIAAEGEKEKQIDVVTGEEEEETSKEGVAAVEQSTEGEERISEAGEINTDVKKTSLDEKDKESNGDIETSKDKEGEKVEEAQNDIYTTSTRTQSTAQADETNEPDETTYITVNEDEGAEEEDEIEDDANAKEVEEGDDIVDYDEAYQEEQEAEGGDHKENVGDDADYEGKTEEEGQIEERENYEEQGDTETANGYSGENQGDEVGKVSERGEEDLVRTRQKRSHGEEESLDDEEAPIVSVGYEETESKRVKIDGN